jgi:hypothetical protein
MLHWSIGGLQPLTHLIEGDCINLTSSFIMDAISFL